MKFFIKLFVKLVCSWHILFVPTVVFSECKDLSFSLANSVWSFNSNPTPSLQVTVSRTGKGGCHYFLTFSTGRGNSYENRLLYNSAYTFPYQLYQGFPYVNILKHFPAVTSNNDVLAGHFKSGSNDLTFSHTYSAILGQTSYARFGSYSDSIIVSLYEGTIGGTSNLVSTSPMTFNFTMPKLIDLSLVNTGSPYDPTNFSYVMNFGTLSAGLVQSFDIVLKYNAGYSLKLSSVNDGKMKNTIGNSFVAYLMSVNGSPIDLNGSSAIPITVSSGMGISGASGLRIPVSVAITSLLNQVAGTYKDTVAITVTSLE